MEIKNRKCLVWVSFRSKTDHRILFMDQFGHTFTSMHNVIHRFQKNINDLQPIIILWECYVLLIFYNVQFVACLVY